jgi:hypothetical protein
MHFMVTNKGKQPTKDERKEEEKNKEWHKHTRIPKNNPR